LGFVFIGMLIAAVIAAFVSSSLHFDPVTVAILTGLVVAPCEIAALFLIAFSSLVGPVVAVERARGLAPLWRSFTLVRPVWRAALGVQLFYGLLTQGLGWLLVRAVEGGAAAAPPGPTPHGSLTPYGFFAAWAENTKFLETVLLEVPIWFLVTPFSLVPFALLYIRAREAEGKPLVADP